MLRIAVDFDGTIVENEYPNVGKPKLFAFETLKMLNRKGHILILWTCREGQRLDEAIVFCKENGVEFYAVNANYPGEDRCNPSSRKIDAHIYIDDRNIGGLMGWTDVWNTIHPEDSVSVQEKNFFKGRFFRKIKKHGNR
ncbi:MAG: hypothetical protein N4A72_04830 [Bacteroidales bacterium]|jgi:hypothetical protein|nr:hypothetical protein [Bacteroidales bacterium]